MRVYRHQIHTRIGCIITISQYEEIEYSSWIMACDVFFSIYIFICTDVITVFLKKRSTDRKYDRPWRRIPMRLMGKVPMNKKSTMYYWVTLQLRLIRHNNCHFITIAAHVKMEHQQLWQVTKWCVNCPSNCRKHTKSCPTSIISRPWYASVNIMLCHIFSKHTY